MALQRTGLRVQGGLPKCSYFPVPALALAVRSMHVCRPAAAIKQQNQGSPATACLVGASKLPGTQLPVAWGAADTGAAGPRKTGEGSATVGGAVQTDSHAGVCTKGDCSCWR